MKVSITKDTRRSIYASQISAAKYVVDAMKEDESTPAEYATYAVNAICRLGGYGESCVSVLKCEACVMPNSRSWGLWGDESENLDIWIDGIAECTDSFVKFGAYLSDIWELDGENSARIAENHMFKVIYTRA